jgi:hypothetical protein
LSLLALIAIGTKIKQKDKVVAGILGVIWVWTGVVYHWAFFSSINILALGYGVVFILQGLFLVWEGVILYNLKFVFGMTVQAYFGYFFILYGLIIYPALLITCLNQIYQGLSLLDYLPLPLF